MDQDVGNKERRGLAGFDATRDSKDTMLRGGGGGPGVAGPVQSYYITAKNVANE